MVSRLVPALAVLAVAASLSSCGGSSDSSDSSSHNAQVISQAQSAATSASQVQAELRSTLHTFHYAGVDNAFKTPQGTCSVDAIYSGAALDTYRNEPTVLLSPDGSVGLEVEYFVGDTTEAYCLKFAADHLGW